jgi:hypothetical protein
MKDCIDDANKLINIAKTSNIIVSDKLMKFINDNKDYIDIASYGSTIATCLLIEKIIESGMIDEIRKIII